MANFTDAPEANLSPAQFAQLLTSDELVAAEKRLPPINLRPTGYSGFPYPLDRPVVYVKFGNRLQYRESEARTQQFAFEALEKMSPADREGIRVPEVYRVFSSHGRTYIIMELVPGKALREIMKELDTNFDEMTSPLFDKIARGIALLLSIPAPNDAKPGPYGGGIIRHPLFKDYVATVEYDSIDMLEQHINRVSTLFVKTAATVKLERKLQLCFSDLYEGNFMFTDSGDLYLIDFEQVSFLPLSFMTYATIQQFVVCGAVARRLDLPQENLPAMKIACSYFIMSTPYLGLPLDYDGADGWCPRQRAKRIAKRAQLQT